MSRDITFKQYEHVMIRAQLRENQEHIHGDQFCRREARYSLELCLIVY